MKALWHLAHGAFSIGAGWERAHEIAQAHEGVAGFDWIHALCHRIEGDHGNAGYWYRRAGRAPVTAAFEAEARQIAEIL